MSALEVLVVMLACVPAVLAVSAGIRARIERQRYLEALEAEREETRRAYDADEEVTARRQSFSQWPWDHRGGIR